MVKLKNNIRILKNNKSIINCTIFICIIIIDQLSKFLLIRKNIQIIPNLLKFTYLENNGAAFGIFNTNIVLISNLLIVIVLLVYWIKSEKNNTKNISLTLIIAGSIGNLVDRVVRGYVIDFIKIWDNIPIFNIADISIVIGLIILLMLNIYNIMQKKEISKIVWLF